jgi:DNA-binding XRE family transcriptional regulator
VRKKREPITATKFARFLNENKLKALDIAREAHVSRQHLLRIRKGDTDPSIMTAMRIRDACGRLLFRRVSIDELFDSTDPQAHRLHLRART